MSQLPAWAASAVGTASERYTSVRRRTGHGIGASRVTEAVSHSIAGVTIGHLVAHPMRPSIFSAMTTIITTGVYLLVPKDVGRSEALDRLVSTATTGEPAPFRPGTAAEFIAERLEAWNEAVGA